MTKFLTALALISLIACTDNSNKPNSAADMSKPETSRIKQLSTPAPVAAQIPHVAEYHGRTLSDPYFWMKDQGYPVVDDEPVLNHLRSENAYFKEFLDPHTKLVDTLFEEFKGRTDEEETSVPYVENGYEYRWFYRPGEEYRTRSRKNLANGEEAIFLDETALAKGHKYFVLGDWEVSADNKYLVYSYDTAGDERYKVRVVDIDTGEPLEAELSDAQGEVSFSQDGKSLIYPLLEKDKWLAKNINVHKIGTAQAQDKTVYHEADDGFFIGFGKTSSKQYFIIVTGSGEVQESYVIPANDLFAKPVKMVSREAGFSQSIDHAHGEFYILANDTHKNFRLAKVSDKNPAY